MDSPRISIITINFNNAAGLLKTVNSVIAQTSSEFEYIIIDGGSTDGSRDIILQNKNALSFWVSEKDQGIYDAMNKGIKAAKGDYLLFLNSGDTLFEPATLGKALHELNDAEIVYGNMKIQKDNVVSDGFMPDVLSFEHMMRDTLWHPVSFIRKSLFGKNGMYDTTFKICGDYDFFFKVIIEKKVSTKHINKFISVFDLSGISSLETNVALIRDEKTRVQRRYISEKEFASFWKKENKKPFKLFERWFR